jgi:prevent-host-death family protein
MAMRQVRIADLKARLSEHLRGVRRGRSITILDRDTPIAYILPYSNDTAKLQIRHPRRQPTKLSRISLPLPLKVDVDIVNLLIEERRGER